MARVSLALLLLGGSSACVVDKSDTPHPGDSTPSETSPPLDTGDTACEVSLWFQDGDGDGFGAAGTSEWACEVPAGMVADGTDCDDTNSTIYPGAPEVCLDGVYNDCADVDGINAAVACGAEGAYSLAYADARLLGRGEGDGAGVAVATAGDTNGDGWADVLVGDLRSDDPEWEASEGNVYLMLGPITSDRLLGEADASIGFEGLVGTDPLFGLSGVGDLDGDGLEDLLIGEVRGEVEGEVRGQVWLFEGPVLGALSGDDAAARLTGVATLDYAGQAVAGPGDVDGDGWGDLLIGAPASEGPAVESTRGECSYSDVDEFGAYEGGEASGNSYLLLGPVIGDRSLTTAELRITAEDGGDGVGFALSEVGDLDGDGLPELFTSADTQCEGGVYSGAVYVVSGFSTGDLSLADADLKLVGEYGWDRAGYAISGAGDVNGDGTPDLLIGAPKWPAGGLQGRAYLELGFAPGIRRLSETEASISGDGTIGYVGLDVSSAEDLDGDGFDDVVVSAPSYSTNGWDDEDSRYAGATGVFYGPIAGSLINMEADKVLHGIEAGDHAGYAISGAGDVDGDGLPDLVIGDLGGYGTSESSGVVWVLLSAGPILTGTLAP